jgi:peptidoglycan/xylan/chitin deacetylase (PgdA/CDA1 family)
MGAILKNTATAIPCRFVLDECAPTDVFREFLAADMRAARLSAAFRTYYRLRSLIPLPVRQLLQRHRPLTASSSWYLPEAFTEALVEELRGSIGGITTIHPWPDGATFAFVPTHDVESSDGMRNISKIAALEEDLGFRSSWNIVPYKYPVDRGLVRDLRSRGFEIGVHGYNHDGKLFMSRRVFERRVPAINAALESFGAVGFRAPMVHRNLAWLQSLNVEYDASCFDADPFQAMPGGVGGVWPFIAGRFVELPYTLPQDHTLFISLQERDGRIWEQKLDYIAKLGGMALLITHPDYLDSGYRLAAYRNLLDKARGMTGMWHNLPNQVSAWWRQRDQSTLRSDPDGRWRIHGPAAGRARVANLRLMGEVPARDERTDSRMEFGEKDSRSAIEWSELATVMGSFNTVAFGTCPTANGQAISGEGAKSCADY